MGQVILSDIEISSGKNANYENFPVGSWLISSSLRSHIKIFYQFARTIDDIADSSMIDAEEKINRLNGFEAALTGVNSPDAAFAVGHRMRESLGKTKITHQHCLDLIKAFKQDAVKARYNNWQELISYCSLSAAPVGRYLLDLHDESEKNYNASDSLCIALQIINHLQDCQDDFKSLDRIYIPKGMLPNNMELGNVLNKDESSREFRFILDQIILEVKKLLDVACSLPFDLKSLRLGMETQIIIVIGNALTRELMIKDPLFERVKLSKMQFARCFFQGVYGYVLNSRNK